MHSSSLLEWNDLSLILAVGRAGSLSGAARHLGVNHSTVFRRLGAIESRTGVRFFDRLPSGYQMTEAGEAAASCAERIESEVHVLGREILGQDTRLRGHIRVTAMETMAALVLPGPLADFSRRHRGLSIEIGGTAAALDLSRREAEVAIRATRKAPDASFGRKICKFRFGLYSTPDYLEANRDVPVQEMDWCVLRGIEGWMVPSVFKRAEDFNARVRLTGASIVSVVEAVASGAGITLLPSYAGALDDRLVQHGEFLERLTLDLWVLTHPDLKETVRVRALMDFLYEVLLERKEMFEHGLRHEAQR